MTKRQAPRPRPISRAASSPRTRYMDFAPKKTGGINTGAVNDAVARRTAPGKKVVESNGIKVSFSSTSRTARSMARVVKPVRRTGTTVGTRAAQGVRAAQGARVARKATRSVRPVDGVARPTAKRMPRPAVERMATKSPAVGYPAVERPTVLESQDDFISMSSITTEDYVDAIMEEEPVGVSMTGIASDANNSPFISSVNVDKRPLSARRIVTEEAYSGAPDDIREEEFFGTPHAHSYTNRREREATVAPAPQISRREAYGNPLDNKISKKTVSPTKDKLRSLIMVLAVALTIVLGVAVGAFIYLAFFQ